MTPDILPKPVPPKADAPQTPPPGDPPRPVKVWDLPTRLFHWSLPVVVTIAYLTGWVFAENTMGVHLWAGYITVMLLVFRLTWGVFGSEYARLKSFSFGPSETLNHIKELARGRPGRCYLGHNPTGALMVFALLGVLVVITISGLLVLGGEENQGPLAGVSRYWLGDAAKSVHVVFVLGLLAMIVLHIGGVFLEIKLTGERLLRAMISGLKTVPGDTPVLCHRKARPLAASLTIGAFVVGAAGALWALSTIPPSGLIAMQPSRVYQAECGDCHAPYHPSLLPRDSWRKLIAGLDNHFGEDASLDPQTTLEISSFLNRYSAENWDTEAANRFRITDPKAPLQITKTPYWLRKHEDLAPADFKLKKVAVRSNCAACHQDADTGRFDDQNIKIPKED